MYISRAVSAGAVWNGIAAMWVPMPQLSAEARRLYEKLHGSERYDAFQESEGTIHGGTPPSNLGPLNVPESEPFYHKPEYDAESVFWSALSAILRVQPVDGEETALSAMSLADAWLRFGRHNIDPERIAMRRTMDEREYVFLGFCRPSYYCSLLQPCMEKVGTLLCDLAQQVAPSYSLMDKPPPRADHLHEAMQRLILNYLVDNRDKDIPLDPNRMRSTVYPGSQANNTTSASGSNHGSVVNARKRTREPEKDEAKKRISMRTKEFTLPVEAMTGFHHPYNPVS